MEGLPSADQSLPQIIHVGNIFHSDLISANTRAAAFDFLAARPEQATPSAEEQGGKVFDALLSMKSAR